MSLFCLLWIPLCYILRRIIVPEAKGSIWALPLGILAVILQYFIGPLILPGDFGFFRWISGFVDVIGLPVLIPCMVCLALMAVKVISADTDYASFVLLWLIPMAAIRSMRWNSPPSLVLLVLVPALWGALALGIPFFIAYIQRVPRWYVIIPAAAGIVALPLSATTSWWAFFSHRPVIGFLFLILTMAPMIISIVMDMVRSTPPEMQTQGEEEEETGEPEIAGNEPMLM